MILILSIQKMWLLPFVLVYFVPARFCQGTLASSFRGMRTTLGKIKYCGKETPTLYSMPSLSCFSLRDVIYQNPRKETEF